MQKLEVEYHRQDSRGSLTQINTGDWKQLNVLKITANQSFGGHYHKKKIELFYVYQGKLDMIVDDVIYSLISGDIVMIGQKERHTLVAIEDTVIVELLSEPYSKEDTFE